MGMWKEGAKAAATLVALPFKLAGGLFNVIGKIVKAIAHTKVGAFLLTGMALLGAGLGIKHLHDKHEQHKQEHIAAMAEDAGALQEKIRQNRIKMAVMSEELGQSNNPSGNARAMVSGQAITGPGVQ